MRILNILPALAFLALGACTVSNDTRNAAENQAAAQSEDLAQRAQAEVGIYQPTHFTRKRLANLIGQMLDDPTLATVSYAQGLDGKLRCIGHTIGFPLPGGSQTTAPTKWGDPPNHYEGYSSVQVPQSEPDQLYYPESSQGTFILKVNVKTGVAKPAYFEGNVQTFTADDLPDPSLVSQGCTEGNVQQPVTIATAGK